MALPLVLGGITLAAIGYGVKKYYDKTDNSWFEMADDIGGLLDQIDDQVHCGFDSLEEYMYQSSDGNDTSYTPSAYQDKLRTFQNEHLKPFRELLSQFQHTSAQLKLEILLEEHTDLYDNFSDLRKQIIVVQLNLIEDIRSLMSRHMRELESVYNVSVDYRAYNESTKNKVDQSIQLANAGNKLLKFNFIDKKICVDGNAVKSFREVITLISQLKRKEQ